MIRYDTRGYGESPGADEEFADRHDVIAMLDAVGVERATLIGASRGGRIALDALLDAPDRVTGLVTVGSTPGGQHDGDATPREQEMIAQMEAASEAGDYEELVRIEVAYWDLGPTREVADVDPAFLTRAIELNVGAAHWDFAGLDQPLEPAAISRLGEVRVPTLVVVGDHDETDSRAGYDLLVDGIAGSRGLPLPRLGAPAERRASRAVHGAAARVPREARPVAATPCTNRASTQLSSVGRKASRRRSP